MKGHPVAYSRSVITELMVPSYTNFGGKVHGGTLMSLMDKLAYVCASKHAGNYCVTVSVDNVQFLRPCLLYTSPSPRDRQKSRMPASA